jgi:hypothetical protein
LSVLMGILAIPFTGPTGLTAESDSGEPIPIAAGVIAIAETFRNCLTSPAAIGDRHAKAPRSTVEFSAQDREKCGPPMESASPVSTIGLTAGQKSAEGVVGHVVGKASEALRTERWRQPIGRAGNGG